LPFAARIFATTVSTSAIVWGLLSARAPTAGGCRSVHDEAAVHA